MLPRLLNLRQSVSENGGQSGEETFVGVDLVGGGDQEPRQYVARRGSGWRLSSATS